MRTRQSPQFNSPEELPTSNFTVAPTVALIAMFFHCRRCINSICPVLSAGWEPRPAQATASQRAASAGFPHLHTLDVSALNQNMLTLNQNSLGTMTISWVTDEVLLRLVGKSPNLTEIDLSGTRVTPAGFRALVEQLNPGWGGASGLDDEDGGNAGGLELGNTPARATAAAGEEGAAAVGGRSGGGSNARLAGLPSSSSTRSSIEDEQQQSRGASGKYSPSWRLSGRGRRGLEGWGGGSAVPPLARVYCLASRVSTDEGLEVLAGLFSQTLRHLAVGKVNALHTSKCK